MHLSAKVGRLGASFGDLILCADGKIDVEFLHA
jgi:hypothetical protein